MSTFEQWIKNGILSENEGYYLIVTLLLLLNSTFLLVLGMESFSIHLLRE